MSPAGAQSCPNCATTLGSIYIRSGKAYLSDGIMLVRIGIRFCPVCGDPFHWHGAEYDKQRGRIPVGVYEAGGTIQPNLT